MSEALLIRRGGGASLNFKVVGGTSQPSSPKENTIWVNTSTAISRWVISITQPSSPVAGMVWIVMGTDYAASISALIGNDNITLSTVKVYQYISNEWTGVNAKVYQSGSWIDLKYREYLYKSGVDNTSITGGWSVYNGSGSGGGGSASIGESYLYVGYHGTNSRDSSIFTNNLVNVYGFKKLCASAKIITAGNNLWFGLATNRAADSHSYFAYYKTSNTANTDLTLEVDISSVTSGKTYYVGIYGDVVNAYIYDIWLE